MNMLRYRRNSGSRNENLIGFAPLLLALLVVVGASGNQERQPAKGRAVQIARSASGTDLLQTEISLLELEELGDDTEELGYPPSPPLVDPKFVKASEAEGHLAPGDLVIGLSINGDHRAYPISYLDGREVVNDTVGGAAVAVTW